MDLYTYSLTCEHSRYATWRLRRARRCSSARLNFPGEGRGAGGSPDGEGAAEAEPGDGVVAKTSR
jgi:hypothetical protein